MITWKMYKIFPLLVFFESIIKAYIIYLYNIILVSYDNIILELLSIKMV